MFVYQCSLKTTFISFYSGFGFAECQLLFQLPYRFDHGASKLTGQTILIDLPLRRSLLFVESCHSPIVDVYALHVNVLDYVYSYAL